MQFKFRSDELQRQLTTRTTPSKFTFQHKDVDRLLMKANFLEIQQRGGPKVPGKIDYTQFGKINNPIWVPFSSPNFVHIL